MMKNLLKKGWTIGSDNDIDELIYTKEINGTLTPWRIWKIYNWVKKNDIGRIKINASHDCSFQRSGQYCSMSIDNCCVTLSFKVTYDC